MNGKRRPLPRPPRPRNLRPPKLIRDRRLSNKGVVTSVSILAGGQSKRMGRDKARLVLSGRSLIAHIRTTVGSLGLPVRVIRRDIIRRCGPLSGIHTALQTSRADSELFLACDMPFVSARVLRRLLRGLRRKDLACFATDGSSAGFPLVIRRQAGPLVQRQIQSGQLSLQELARALQARRILVQPTEAVTLFNINTPEEWAAARTQPQMNTARRSHNRIHTKTRE